MINDFDYPNWRMKVFLLLDETDVFSKPLMEWSRSNITDEITAVLIIIGGVLICFLLHVFIMFYSN